jgi:hypothetical protein
VETAAKPAAPLGEGEAHRHHAVEREEACGGGEHEERGEGEHGALPRPVRQRRQRELHPEPVEGLGEAVGEGERVVADLAQLVLAARREGEARAGKLQGAEGGVVQEAGEPPHVEDDPLAIAAIAGQHRAQQQQVLAGEAPDEGVDGHAPLVAGSGSRRARRHLGARRPGRRGRFGDQHLALPLLALSPVVHD